MKLLQQFLEEASLDKAVERIDSNRFRYKYILGTIDFVSLPNNATQFYQTHIDTWCEDQTIFFVAAIGDKCIHICDSRIKPRPENPISNATICSFNYGENSDETLHFKNWFSKQNIDSGLCLREIQQLIDGQNRIHCTINEDLLKNLKNRRENIIRLLKDSPDKETIAQKLLDRCLFIRFIEDRANLNTLKDILSKSNGMIDLLKLFDYYNDHLNGDLFERGDIPVNINNRILSELKLIFGSSYFLATDTNWSQSTLVPYNFNKIPVVLISNIYETFLAHERRKRQGIVFTPENLVIYALNKVFDDPQALAILSLEDFKILDPACGSGAFLVKAFERIVNDRRLSIEKKADIVRKHLFGIDINGDALRIAALSLYLKIIENETPENIKAKLFADKEPHFMFPGLRGTNLHESDSIFSNTLEDFKFDLIIGNPPWGANYSREQKKVISNKWPGVSDYQSSQVFLLSISKWMAEKSICAMIVNLSNFTNSFSKEFRLQLINDYSLKTFVNLTKVKPIIFGAKSEPSCIIIFDKKQRETIDFIIPELTRLSKQTHIIMDGNKATVPITALKDQDDLWHIYGMGYDCYNDLLRNLEENNLVLNSFRKNPKEPNGFEQGLIEWSERKGKELGLSREQFDEKFKASWKKGPEYWPYVDSVSSAEPYFGAIPKKYLVHGPHLERGRDFDLFTGNKLITTRIWPVKAFVVEDTILFNTDFHIFKLNDDYSDELLFVLEAILNSSLAYMYLEVKFRQRKEGSFTKINKEDLGVLPIPDLKEKKELANAIIEKVKLQQCNFETIDKSKEIDSLVFQLYDLDYYFEQEVLHYADIEIARIKVLKSEDVLAYCKEFSKTFKPFLREDLQLIPSFFISEYHTLVQFSIRDILDKSLAEYNEQLEEKILTIEAKDVAMYYRTFSMKEAKKTFYEGDKLFIFKPTEKRYWTPFSAILDANEEIKLFFKKMRYS